MGSQNPVATEGIDANHGDGKARAVGAVVLAAGRSTRFREGNKLLADVDGRSVVRRATEPLLATDLRGPIVVLGYQAEAVWSALDGLDVSARVNEDYTEGQSTSVAVGVEAARKRDWDAVVFALGDMPDVAPATIETLVTAYRQERGSVLAPIQDGTRGNPVLFDSRHFDALATVSGDRGGRDIVESEGTLLPVDDPGVRRDIDRVEDL